MELLRQPSILVEYQTLVNISLLLWAVLLLSYTSLASTSFQLLRSLTHLMMLMVHSLIPHQMWNTLVVDSYVMYKIVAISCAVVFILAFPLSLLTEPFLKRYFSLVRIKSLLDQFQGSYKDRQISLVLVANCWLVIYDNFNNSMNKLYYLQTSCVLVVLIHVWIQSYTNTNYLTYWMLPLLINLTTFSFNLQSLQL